MAPKGLHNLKNSLCGGIDYMEDCVPKETLGSQQSETDIWSYKAHQPDLHEVGGVWQFQEHCPKVDGESRADSA
ncbi:hypothetical protein OAK48_03665 [Deltaproteobacteria bacterium]|nr:hypothetical protein [Deltaproteobacteria bacterium]